MTEEKMTSPAVTDEVRVPDHVVYREFAAETVVLNLRTGLYHGLNSTGGRMLEAVEAAGSISAAVEKLADGWDVPRTRVERDLRAFCAGLAERGLLELYGDRGR
jgi:hypothetical protein